MAILEGVYRRFIPLKGGKAALDARLTQIESLAVDQVAPPGMEFTRAGRRFYLGFNGTAPTGIAPVQAFPTTAAQWAITNNDAYKSLFFTTLGLIAFAGTIGSGAALLACVFNTPAQTGFATGLAVANASNSSLGSKVSVKSGVTITAPAAPVWFPVADPVFSGAPTIPSIVVSNRFVDGRVAVEPGQSLGLVAFAPAGTAALFLPVAEWLEAEHDME